jgi:hypothetical protein
MPTNNPYSYPGTNPDAVVINPANTQVTDGSPVVLGSGHQGEQLVADLHGRYGTMAARGGVFMGASTSAAIAIPVVTTTNAHTFMLANPAGTNKNVEVIRFALNFLDTNAGPGSATVIGFSFVPLASNAISALTKIPDPVSAGGHAVNMSGLVPQATLYSAATTASALTVAANWGFPMFSFPASWVPTVGGSPVPYFYDFAGTLILPPGWAITLVSSTAWGSNTVIPSLTWAEYFQ